jgi:5-methyltetrahydrofolate--homocysteine methyltransferase
MVEVTPAGPVQIIGERINPSGRPALRRALREGDFSLLVEEARCQVAAGASVVDVNVGGKGLDEVALLPLAVQAVAGAVDVPLSIDTRIPAALEAALAVCPGRPLINSISAEKKALAELLPIVAARRLPVIALCMGPDGIPGTVEGRLRYAEEALEAAVRAGISAEEVVLDPLVMTVGADDQAGQTVLQTVRRLRERYPDNNITGGASNISFGMPERLRLNAGFLTVAAYLGMNLPITDPTDPGLRFAQLSATILAGHDRRTRSYVRFCRASQAD